jgi:hypothetical protein
MNKGKKIIKIIFIAVLCFVLMGAVVMLLWNWLVPPLFSGPAITFWQAVGLFLLAKIFFGGWGGGRCRPGGPAGWRNRYYEKLSTMSPEDRERFKQRMSEKWCSGSSHKSTPGDISNG